MRIVFFGTPALAVPYLEAAARGRELVGVVCQPDKPVGRKKTVTPPPVKVKALELGVPVFQGRPRDHEPELAALRPDLFLVVAYGRILKPSTLAIPVHGALNVHFSLLPKFRGAAPMQHSLLAGETETGVTLFWLDEGVDTGPVQSVKRIPLDVDDDAATLGEKLNVLGVQAAQEALRDIEAGRIRREPQPAGGTLAPKLSKEQARFGFDEPAGAIHNKVRALMQWPKAETVWRGKRLFVTETRLGPERGGAPGTFVEMERDKGILIQCATGTIWLRRVQPEGGKSMDAASFFNGSPLAPGAPVSA